MNLDTAIFLTSYDPSDLPGGSLDPLGFDKTYNLLADKILPGITNAAGTPRYWSVLAAAAHWARDAAGATPRKQIAARMEIVLRAERLWAVACVLASMRNEALPVAGLRGVTFARTYAVNAGRRIDGEFRMLSRQVPYGMIGIYGAVANGMAIWRRTTLELTEGLGARLAAAFLEETDAPAALEATARGEAAIAADVLADWGERAHIAAPIGAQEGKLLGEALHGDAVRSRMARLLARYRPRDGEPELLRLQRIADAAETDPDLREALVAILAFERGFRSASLVLERLLTLCSEHGSVESRLLATDEVLDAARAAIADAYSAFASALDESATAAFRAELQRAEDVRRFLREMASAPSNEALCAVVMERHHQVQRGKLAGGKRKMPWLHRVGSRIEAQLAIANRVAPRARTIDDIPPHVYRTHSADALLVAAREA